MGGPFPIKQLPRILIAIESKCYNSNNTLPNQEGYIPPGQGRYTLPSQGRYTPPGRRFLTREGKLHLTKTRGSKTPPDHPPLGAYVAFLH